MSFVHVVFFYPFCCDINKASKIICGGVIINEKSNMDIGICGGNVYTFIMRSNKELGKYADECNKSYYRN